MTSIEKQMKEIDSTEDKLDALIKECTQIIDGVLDKYNSGQINLNEMSKLVKEAHDKRENMKVEVEHLQRMRIEKYQAIESRRNFSN